jgi:hypothetical protein
MLLSSMNVRYFNLLIHVGRKGSRFVILSEAAAGAKDLCFVNKRCFAAAQHDKPIKEFRCRVLGRSIHQKLRRARPNSMPSKNAIATYGSHGRSFSRSSSTPRTIDSGLSCS